MSTIPRVNDIPLTANRTVEFRPGDPNTPAHELVFYLRVPTFEDRDTIGIRMYRRNLRQIGPEQIRALMISELYSFMDEEQAEETARFLEDYWKRQDAYATEMASWAYRVRQQRFDHQEGAPEIPFELEPVETTSPRERARAQLVTEDVVNASQRVRDKLAEQHGYDAKFRLVTFQMQVAGWVGLDTTATFDADNCVTADAVEALRGELERRHLGEVFAEVANEASDMFALEWGAEKNSTSPRGNTSDLLGSSSLSTGSAMTDGPSTTSSTGPTPASASPKTSATSSRRTRTSGDPKKRKAGTADIPTVGNTSTSRSGS